MNSDRTCPVSRGIALAALGLICALLAMGASPSLAQSSPAASQQLLRSLPPEQQRAVMQQIMGGRGKAGESAERSANEQSSPSARDDARDGDDETPRRLLRLGGGDTVLIDLWVRDPGDSDDYETLRQRRERERMLELGTAAGQQVAVPAQPSTAPRSSSEQGPSGAERRREARERERELRAERTEEQERRLEQFRDRILDRNPYKLDPAGALEIPGLPAIALAGLTEEQATRRLANDPSLRDFRVLLTILPLERQGADALEPFGYDLFDSAPSTFAPVRDVSVPVGYVIGPGDVLEVELLGNASGSYSLEVGRGGQIVLPDIGPVAVSGMRFDEAREAIEGKVSRQLIGTRAVVSMGELRSIQVFITGEAQQPGAYTLSALSTVTSALFSSGGIKKIGSLRDIQLRRGGAVVARLDLYDLLQRGDARDDQRLLSGDVIFIPPIGPTVSVVGEVLRPAIYELKGTVTAGELLGLTGGLTASADPRIATLERVDGRRKRVVLDIDLSTPPGRLTRLQDGDLLRLRPVSPVVANSIVVEGHVQNSSVFAWREGLRIADVLTSERDLRPNADRRYVLIRRESEPDRAVSVLSADLVSAWASPSSAANVALAPRDRIIVFDEESGRDRQLQPILAELRRQAVQGAPSPIVRISGGVRAPGEYPLEPGMTISDLLRAGGRLGESAYAGEAELTRFEVVGGASRQAQTVRVELARVLAGDITADLELKPFDFLVVKDVPQWAAEAEVVTLLGEVRFPGKYPIKRGETLSSLLSRAGGLTDLAFAEGSVFTRESLRERERQQIEALSERVRRDVAAAALAAMQAPGAPSQRAQDTVSIGESLLESLRDAKAVGRLVVDLPRAVRQPGSSFDVMLRGGDEIMIPMRSQEVTVLGEVQAGTSHLYDPRLSRDDYVSMSGGVTQKADRGRVYVVRANGAVVGGEGSQWFRRNAAEIRPGDTIIVPLDAERLPPLPLWQAVTSIVYNLAVATAAVRSF